MPNRESTPRVFYRRHKPSGQAVVTLNGRDVYLGQVGAKASRGEYERLIGKWLAGGRRLATSETMLTVAELALAYWSFAKSYYRKDGKPTGTLASIRVALRVLRQFCGSRLAADFGRLALRALQRNMIDLGHSRTYINGNVNRIRRVFRWGVAEELVPASVYQALNAAQWPARHVNGARRFADREVLVTLWAMPAAREVSRRSGGA